MCGEGDNKRYSITLLLLDWRVLERELTQRKSRTGLPADSRARQVVNTPHSCTRHNRGWQMTPVPVSLLWSWRNLELWSWYSPSPGVCIEMLYKVRTKSCFLIATHWVCPEGQLPCYLLLADSLAIWQTSQMEKHRHLSSGEELIFSECQIGDTNVATWPLGDGDLPNNLLSGYWQTLWNQGYNYEMAVPLPNTQQWVSTDRTLLSG